MYIWKCSKQLLIATGRARLSMPANAIVSDSVDTIIGKSSHQARNVTRLFGDGVSDPIIAGWPVLLQNLFFGRRDLTTAVRRLGFM